MNRPIRRLAVVASLMFFAAVKYMPLADVFAIYFVEPFMLTMMSALFLGDRVGWKRWTTAFAPPAAAPHWRLWMSAMPRP